MKAIYLLLFIFCLVATMLCAAENHHVLFGERNFEYEMPSVYFDRNGKPYPDYFIADSLLMQCHASLDTFYVQHPVIFANITAQYRCTFQDYSPVHVQTLNDSIFRFIERKISSAYSDAMPLLLMVHGFRKSFVNVPGIYTSVIDYSILSDTLKKFATMPQGFVRIFWDGLYGNVSFKLKKVKAIFKLYEDAQENAHGASVGLRNLLAVLPQKQINIVCHSLGARVVSDALFDTTSNALATPGQQLRVCFIAPAIAGTGTFEKYFQRCTTIDFNMKDNYNLLVLYNKKDFVLKKRDFVFGVFGPGPRKHGITTLGCDSRHETRKVKKYFDEHYPHSPIAFLNMTKAVKKCHHLRCYCSGDNLIKVVAFLEGKAIH